LKEKNKATDFIDTFSWINNKKGYIQEKLFGQTNILYGKKIMKMSCGDGFSLALDSDGLLYSWGKGTLGQLGYELLYDKAEIIDNQKCQLTPRLIEAFKEKNVLITDMYCGRDFVLAYSSNNLPFTWGNNDHFQLARDSHITYDSKPEIAKAIVEQSFNKIIKTCCGWMHGCVLDEKGDAYIWGNPYFDYDKNFYDLKELMRIKIDYRIIDIACGFHHFCFLVLEDNMTQLYTFGVNDFGQLGYKTDEEISLEPKRVDLYDYKPEQIFCGPYHSLCLVSEGKIFAWGHNYNKEIGNFSDDFVTKPTEYGWKIKDDSKIKKVFFTINNYCRFYAEMASLLLRKFH
jgi:alpha-tubulin suppressor-like RCC1 family protein